jgi:hypothetical protein
VSRLRFVIALIPLLVAGCVERSLVIRSDPPGAEVYIDGERKGMTPHTEKYVWYGTREVTLVKSDYRSHREMVELHAPWWQVFPFDLITDVVLPLTLTDKVELDIKLHKEPPKARGMDETLERANEAREKSRRPVDAPR